MRHDEIEILMKTHTLPELPTGFEWEWNRWDGDVYLHYNYKPHICRWRVGWASNRPPSHDTTDSSVVAYSISPTQYQFAPAPTLQDAINILSQMAWMGLVCTEVT